MTHDYKRYGTTTLLAALSLLDGTVIGDCLPRHRHQEFLWFLKKIDVETPATLDLHLILDNDATHKHPAVHRWVSGIHASTCTSSRHPVHGSTWSNAGSATRRSGAFAVESSAASQSSFRRLRSIPATIMLTPKPFVWTKSAQDILAKVHRARVALDKTRTA